MSSTSKEYKNIKLKFINQYSLLVQEHEICGKICDMLIIGKYALAYAFMRSHVRYKLACLINTHCNSKQKSEVPTTSDIG